MRPASYPIISVDPDAEREHEQMGSKAKFWYRVGHEKWLFKRCREGTGEDWAEKVAAEVAAVLGLPHARVELADLEGTRGSVTFDFAGQSTLIHGNELLWEMDESYPVHQSYRVSAHTIDNVFRVLSMTDLGPPTTTAGSLGMTAAEVLAGYLALDALIGNSDRHHENWGLLRDGDRVVLAPTYDHASSLGRELLDGKRSDLLARTGGVAGYARKARSALYGTPTDTRPLSTHGAFCAYCARIPGAEVAWTRRIEEISADALAEIIARVDSRRISEAGAAFALQLMLENRRILTSQAPASP